MSKFGWRSKLIGLFTVVLIASLLFQLLYVVPYARDREVDHAKDHQEETAQNIARELDMDLSNLMESMTVIADQPVFNEMDIENQTEINIQSVEIIPNLSSLFVMNDTGWFVSDNIENISMYTTQSFASRPYFIVPFEQSEVYFTTPRFYRTTGYVATSISVPIKSSTREIVGVMMGGMILNDLIERVKDYPLEESETIYLVDTKGTVVAQSEIDLFTLEDGPLSINYTDRSLVQAIMAGETGESREYDRSGTPYFGTFILLESNEWGVVVETPMNKIVAESDMLTRQLLLVNIILFVIALSISLAFTQQITTERKRDEEKLKKSSEQLAEKMDELRDTQEQLVRKEKLAVLGQLAGGVSHELRNPLGAIKNAGYFLNMAIDNPEPEVKESLEILDREVATSESIISSLLDFGRTKQATPQKVDLNNIIRKSLTRISVPENIKVVDQLNPTLPIIMADPNQLDQVFGNLILNGIQAIPKSGGRLVIKSEMKKPELIAVSVTDTGEGIPKENMEKLIEPLYTGKAKGIGLGLAISKTLVEGNNGTIEVKSKAGIGSTFTVNLPVIEKEGLNE